MKYQALAFYLLGVLSMASCASVWTFRSYNAEIRDRTITEADVGKSLADLAYSEGMLLGKLGSDGWPDLPLSDCKPDATNKMKCATMMLPEFYRLKDDDEKCHERLQACENPPPSSR